MNELGGVNVRKKIIHEPNIHKFRVFVLRSYLTTYHSIIVVCLIRALELAMLTLLEFGLHGVDVRLSLPLETIDYATFAPMMQLKMRHTLCWNVPYITPLEESFHHYLRM